MNQPIEITPQVKSLRTAARKFAWAEGLSGFTNATPVWVRANSDEPPTMIGEGWHFRTRGGTRISHPNAYAKSGWSNMVYNHSTLRLVVGENWKPDETNS